MRGDEVSIRTIKNLLASLWVVDVDWYIIPVDTAKSPTPTEVNDSLLDLSMVSLHPSHPQRLDFFLGFFLT
jgi:hypothetical protein